jgi:hypothetical protein
MPDIAPVLASDLSSRQATPLRHPLPHGPARLLLMLAIGALALWPGQLGAMVRSTLADAYIGVAVFVAATLALAYGAERGFDLSFGRALEGRRVLQVPIAAFLGMLPGCAGAVMVTASYTAGRWRLPPAPQCRQRCFRPFRRFCLATAFTSSRPAS